MKVIILAGGLGSRISEESHLKPKPMIEIGGQPILWHIMKIFHHQNINDFIICAGYKQHVIKEYFSDYFLHRSDVTFDFSNGNKVETHMNSAEPWKVTIVDTGLNTMTGGRIKRIQKYIGEETFMLTYGDGVSNIDVKALLDFHRSHGKIATITSVRVTQRFGVLDISHDNSIRNFREKKKNDDIVINGGFMVLQPEIFELINGDETVLEEGPFEACAARGQLMTYRHPGFWQCMDTQRDKAYLEKLWADKSPPWKVW